MEKNKLINRLKAGEIKALDEAISLYSNLAFKVSYDILKEKREATEVVQSVFMVMYANVDKFNGDEKLFKNWICTISKGISLEYKGLK
ncbi:MAG: sigma factor [Clostridium sp.]|uniref:sigma factor n=1 Tax=Clostridium sp. TaxID=1506 RepID=UPI003F411436